MLTEQVHTFVDLLAKLLELFGVAIILGGIILATVTFLRDGARTGLIGQFLDTMGRGRELPPPKKEEPRC